MHKAWRTVASGKKNSNLYKVSLLNKAVVRIQVVLLCFFYFMICSKYCLLRVTKVIEDLLKI
ncbi:hypothetical protein A0J52_17190 [Clostridium sporogenes]|uniref:hypothetical protein n=1 Tax=Clostridium sporogenes TaxID=1509 RepID=UPI0005F056D4|nr:hypothetical protein [Clostridium sporogenes]KOY66855.1 hypothetical protein AN649_06020 [Clostridium sporogenes]KYN76104.1 hypothetical protein A0J52_17190 [Clostridium sporogenes]